MPRGNRGNTIPAIVSLKNFVVGALLGFAALGALTDSSLSAQVEYRGRFSERFGYVVFVGAGVGGGNLNDLSIDNGGVAYGVGIRYRLAKKFKLDYAIDYAINDNGDETLSFSLGQKF